MVMLVISQGVKGQVETPQGNVPPGPQQGNVPYGPQGAVPTGCAVQVPTPIATCGNPCKVKVHHCDDPCKVSHRGPCGEHLHKVKVEGVVVDLNGNVVTIQDCNGVNTPVLLNECTEYKKKHCKEECGTHSRYDASAILPGLFLKAEGRTYNDNALVAEKIDFREDDRRAAVTADIRVRPVEARVEEAMVGVAENTKRIEATNQNLSATNAELQNTNSQLQATKSDLQNTNAQLQSTTAQLQTTKADLQATRASLRNTNVVIYDDTGETVRYKVASAKLAPSTRARLAKMSARNNCMKKTSSIKGTTIGERKNLRQRKVYAVKRNNRNELELHRVSYPIGKGVKKSNVTVKGKKQNLRSTNKVHAKKVLNTEPTQK